MVYSLTSKTLEAEDLKAARREKVGRAHVELLAKLTADKWAAFVAFATVLAF